MKLKRKELTPSKTTTECDLPTQVHKFKVISRMFSTILEMRNKCTEYHRDYCNYFHNKIFYLTHSLTHSLAVALETLTVQHI